MDKRKYLLQIANGREPQRRYYRLYGYENMKKRLLSEKEIDYDDNIEIIIVSNKDELRLSLQNEDEDSLSDNK